MPGMPAIDPIDAPLHRWMARHRRVFALTGAGCSTASGIPDYRDDRGDWKRRPPVMIQAFRSDEAVYRRYWARACAGWSRFSAAAPGAAHRAFAQWDRMGTLSMLVTQNVDGLHDRAGSRAVIDLHGRLDEVVCLGCGDRTSRAALQETMIDGQPRVGCRVGAGARRRRRHRRRADRGVRRAAVPVAVAACSSRTWCSSARTCPTTRYEAARDALAHADALLVAGSSLMVYSGFRFVRQAHEDGLSIAIVNRGRTRGDDLAELKVEGDVGQVLTDALARRDRRRYATAADTRTPP